MTQDQEFRLLLDNLGRRLNTPGEALPGARAHTTMDPLGTREPPGPSGERRQKTRRGEAPGIYRESAVLILLTPRPGPEGLEVFIPLIERARDGGPHAGQIALPGGGRDPRDTSLEETALREAREEIGLDTGGCTVLGRLSPLAVAVSSYLITPVLAWTEAPLESIPLCPNPREVARILPLSPGRLSGTEGTVSLEVRGVLRSVPAYRLTPRPLWGATAMIFAELLSLLPRWPRTSLAEPALTITPPRGEPEAQDARRASDCSGG
ncbi:NUDIX hydrolase [Alkalispirochaeta alkalica]|uniref:NUDIX hydrolase n=1 Tax=Alkalispirochaeta alkalica TaxID=46356 RepID=UPI00037F66C0|nr:CoA pyrophosphatase [Alkalispirochaeta alkalica]